MANRNTSSHDVARLRLHYSLTSERCSAVRRTEIKVSKRLEIESCALHLLNRLPNVYLLGPLEGENGRPSFLLPPSTPPPAPPRRKMEWSLSSGLRWAGRSRS